MVAADDFTECAWRKIDSYSSGRGPSDSSASRSFESCCSRSCASLMKSARYFDVSS
jgi:hypothetical protein